MIYHWNFQELLFTDRICKIYMIFKFSEFVIRSLFSAGGPYFPPVTRMLIIEWVNKNSSQIEQCWMWLACINCHRILSDHVCKGQTYWRYFIIIFIQMYEVCPKSSWTAFKIILSVIGFSRNSTKYYFNLMSSSAYFIRLSNVETNRKQLP